MPWYGKLNPYESPRFTEEENKAKSQRQWTRKEIYETVADILVDSLGVDREEITPEASLVGDLGAD